MGTRVRLHESELKTIDSKLVLVTKTAREEVQVGRLAR